MRRIMMYINYHKVLMNTHDKIYIIYNNVIIDCNHLIIAAYSRLEIFNHV